jgi:hypothetical protein
LDNGNNSCKGLSPSLSIWQIFIPRRSVQCNVYSYMVILSVVHIAQQVLTMERIIIYLRHSDYFLLITLSSINISCKAEYYNIIRFQSLKGVVVVVNVLQLDLWLPFQSVTITSNAMSSSPVHGEVYSIQQYVITRFSDLRQVGDFHWVLRFPPPMKLTSTIKLKYCWKWR